MKNIILTLSLLISPLLLADSGQKKQINNTIIVKSCRGGSCSQRPQIIHQPRQQRPIPMPKREEKKIYWQDFNKKQN